MLAQKVRVKLNTPSIKLWPYMYVYKKCKHAVYHKLLLLINHFGNN